MGLRRRAFDLAFNAPVRFAYRCAHRGLRAYWLVRKPETHGALVAIWRGDRLLLIRSSYRRTLSLPGGYLKAGEESREAAMRELEEELGVRVSVDAVRHAFHVSLPFEHRTDTLDIFEVDDKAGQLEVRVNHRELVWSGWKTTSEALALDIVPHVREYLQRRATQT